MSRKTKRHIDLVGKAFVRLRWEGWVPKLLLLERNEKRVRWTLRAIVAVGIALSVVSMAWWAGLAVTLLLLALEQFFERTVFVYSWPLGSDACF